MKLNTKRLAMVPLGPEYLLSTHKYASDFENTKYMEHLPNLNLEETKLFLARAGSEWGKESPNFYEFAILVKNEHIGAVSICFNQENGEGELGWIICKKYWGNGYATEAASEIVRFASAELKIRKFFARCDSENVGSYKVMEELNMTLVKKSRGRKNKLSDEDREELTYCLKV